MTIKRKELILATGNAIELAGNITLAAASIFGILSSFLVLVIANKESD